MDECDCGYCGKCQEQHQHEVESRPTSSYDKPQEDEDDTPKHYYWRI